MLDSQCQITLVREGCRPLHGGSVPDRGDSFGMGRRLSVIASLIGPSGPLRMVVSPSGLAIHIYGEFDPGSGRTLAACLTHASRTVTAELALPDQWRTGE